MERHEARVKVLMENPKIGHYFRALMLQWEKNNEPPPSLFLEGESSIISVQQAEKERRMRDMARRGDNRAVMDLDEESYFNEDEDEEPINDGSLTATKTTYRRSNDNGQEKDIKDTVTDIQQPQIASIDQDDLPTLEVLPQKRKKRELDDDEKDDEDGMMGRLAKRKSISHTEDVNDTGGGFIKEEETIEDDQITKPPSKRMTINLTPNSEKMVKKDVD
jgi:hypothetical protein